MSDPMKPCQFCQGPARKIFKGSYLHIHQTAIECTICGARGPWNASEDAALAAWNTRAYKQAQADAPAPSLALAHEALRPCKGEQYQFIEWAKAEGYDMTEHPLHWLFLNKETYAARKGWSAALAYALTALPGAPAPAESRVSVPEGVADIARQLIALSGKATPPPWDTISGSMVRAIKGDLAVPIFESHAPIDWHKKKNLTHKVMCAAYADEVNNASFMAFARNHAADIARAYLATAPQGASVSPAPEVPSGDAAHQAFLDACENPAPPTEELKAVVRDYGKYAAPAASAVADEARIRAEEAEACAKVAAAYGDAHAKIEADAEAQGYEQSARRECDMKLLAREIETAILSRIPAAPSVGQEGDGSAEP